MRIHNIVINTLPARFLMLIRICIALEKKIVFCFFAQLLWKLNFAGTVVFWFPVTFSMQELIAYEQFLVEKITEFSRLVKK